MVLQFFVDDSGNEPSQRVYVLGGLLSTVESWAHFSDEWQAILDGPPKLDFYKFTQSRALKGQFTDWTDAQRDERVARLAQTAAAHAAQRFDVLLWHEDWHEHVRAVPIVNRQLMSDHPYLWMAGRLLGSLSAYLVTLNIREPVQVVFDSQDGFDAELMRYWPEFIDLDHPEFGKANFEGISFQKDQIFLPLQACDMLAGSIRHGIVTNEILPEVRTLLTGIAGGGDNLSETDLPEFGSELRKRSAQVAQEQPHLVLRGFNKATAARERKKDRRKDRP